MNQGERFKKKVNIGGLPVGPGFPPFLVAEIGGNHGGDPALARRMVDAAQEAGAQAVKFQVYNTEAFLRGDSQYYQELATEELSHQDLEDLAGYCRARNIIFFFSVFGPADVDLARALDVPAVKISSGDIDNLPLLEAAASLDKPILLSTGAAHLSEVDTALGFLHTKGADRIVLLQCTSLYPCPDDQANLRVIPEFQNRYQIPIGFSDHTLGVDIPVAAVALGASLVEKHFTIDHGLPGGDNDISCLPDEFKSLARAARRVSAALGSEVKHPTPGEKDMRLPIRRSLVATCEIKPGETLTADHIGLKRPGGGLEPKHYSHLLGRRARAHLAKDEPFSWDKVEQMIKVCLPLSHQLEQGVPPELLSYADVLEYRRPEASPVEFSSPSVFHWGLGLTQEDFIPAYKAQGLGAFLQTINAELFSFDLGPACRRNLFILPLSPTLTPDEIKGDAAKALDLVRKSYSGKLAAENYNYYPTGMYEHICRPDFMADFLTEFDLGLILDLAHAAVSAQNLKLDLEAYLLEMPMERVVEIHISKPYFHPITAVDAHGAPGNEEFRLLEFVLKHLPPSSDVLVAVEYYAEVETIVTNYRRLRALVDAHNQNLWPQNNLKAVQGGYFVR